MKKPAIHAPNVWVPLKFGIVSRTLVDVRRLLAKKLDRLARLHASPALANAAEGWLPKNEMTVYPYDALPTNGVYPYAIRYLLAAFAPAGSTLPTASYGYTIPSNRITGLYPINPPDQTIPLGIVMDEPDNTMLESQPIGVNLRLLGSGQTESAVGITDSVVPYGTILVPSTTAAGQLKAMPNVPGIYWGVGLSISDSEGVGAQIMFDPRVAAYGVDVLT